MLPFLQRNTCKFSGTTIRKDTWLFVPIYALLQGKKGLETWQNISFVYVRLHTVRRSICEKKSKCIYKLESSAIINAQMNNFI